MDAPFAAPTETIERLRAALVRSPRFLCLDLASRPDGSLASGSSAHVAPASAGAVPAAHVAPFERPSRDGRQLDVEVFSRRLRQQLVPTQLPTPVIWAHAHRPRSPEARAFESLLPGIEPLDLQEIVRAAVKTGRAPRLADLVDRAGGLDDGALANRRIFEEARVGPGTGAELMGRMLRESLAALMRDDAPVERRREDRRQGERRQAEVPVIVERRAGEDRRSGERRGDDRRAVGGQTSEPSISTPATAPSPLAATGSAGRPLSADRQIYFHRRLVDSRKRILGPLERTVRRVDARTLTAELTHFVPSDVLAHVAAGSLHPAFIFPTPCIIEVEPPLVGYYRLLLGISKKDFYDDPIRRIFMPSEERGTFAPRQRENCAALCEQMCAALADLIRAVPDISLNDLAELSLLTLGDQYSGAWKVLLGQKAEAEVFDAFYQALRHVPSACKETAKLITLLDRDGAAIRIRRQPDPDVSIERLMGTTWTLETAVEIKGGRDRSNAHNRAGEAEKSHAKTSHGDVRHWTIAMSVGLNADVIAMESGRTDEWFDVEHVRVCTGADWERFRLVLAAAVNVSAA